MIKDEFRSEVKQEYDQEVKAEIDEQQGAPFGAIGVVVEDFCAEGEEQAGLENWRGVSGSHNNLLARGTRRWNSRILSRLLWRDSSNKEDIGMLQELI